MNISKYLYLKLRHKIPNILVQTELCDTFMTVSLRDHLFWLLDGEHRRKHLAEELPLPNPIGKVMWDLGCNIGTQSVRAARKGWRVVAFDISALNIRCLNQTAHLNGLNIEAIHSPVTVKRVSWAPAKSGFLEERLLTSSTDYHQFLVHSWTYRGASEHFGMPQFIKMDIEGAEKEFLLSLEFREWVRENCITLYVETHDNNHEYLWPEFKQLDNNHYILCPLK